MRHDTDDWPEGFLIAVPHAWRDDGLWHDMQAQTQERIGMKLRELYVDLLQQPLSPALTGLVQDIERHRDASAVRGSGHAARRSWC
ncbi:hypothetical protein [Microvirga sp. M2]|uniref:hypothetical protein n=1 Tax=Microvirga sp. M2 TaxID=3073270 RepID=UPI0039C22D42